MTVDERLAAVFERHPELGRGDDDRKLLAYYLETYCGHIIPPHVWSEIPSFRTIQQAQQRFRAQHRDAFPLPRLSPTVEKAFYSFITDTDRNVMPQHGQRAQFYRFIRMAHLRRSRLSVSELQGMLLDHGFSEDLASKLALIYQHGRALLRAPNPDTWDRNTAFDRQ